MSKGFAGPEKGHVACHSASLLISRHNIVDCVRRDAEVRSPSKYQIMIGYMGHDRKSAPGARKQKAESRYKLWNQNKILVFIL